MMRRSMRKRCAELIGSLDLKAPLRAEELCRQVAERRNRPIRLAPLAFPHGGPVGLLVSTASVDYIFYEAHTSVPHQTHIIAHELGHLLWGHSSAASTDAVTPIVPESIDPTLVKHMLGRTLYSQPEEFAAEYFATQVLRRTSEWTIEASSVPEDERELVERLERSLRPGPEEHA
ncbi:ParH-like protein [Streptomyces sp. NPDC057052]|uniref:ParH-like protein n=1 Tax=Streptomyces sp. NPDC057052 TaxID=3346010 RepID=UPI003631F859